MLGRAKLRGGDCAAKPDAVTDARLLPVGPLGACGTAACAARARLVGPALALLLLAAAAQSDAFWRASRLDYERARAATRRQTATAASLVWKAAQDNRPVRYSLHGWSNPFRRAKLL